MNNPHQPPDPPGPATATFKALSNVHRLRMLQLLAETSGQTWTVRRLADSLEVPRTRLYHHVKVLLEHSLIEVAERRPVRGGEEAHYRCTQRGAAAVGADSRPQEPGDRPDGGATRAPTRATGELQPIRPPHFGPRNRARPEQSAIPSGTRRRRNRTSPSKENHVTKTRLAEILAAALALVVGLYAFAFDGAGGFAGLKGNEGALGAAAPEEETEGLHGPAEPDDMWFEAQRAGGPGKVPNQAQMVKAQRQAQNLRASEKAAARSNGKGNGAQAPRHLRGAWQHVGPNNVGGRIVDVVVDVDDPNVVWAAAASGGIWKGTAHDDDGGLTMEYAWNDDLVQGMGSIAMGSDGRLWAGTGEHNPGGGSTTYPGDGVYVSSDRGQSWKNVGLGNSHNTGEIAVRPDDPNTIFVAAAGSLFNPGGERGVYRSTNGGSSWELVLPPETPFSGGVDLAIHPDNPERIYAAMWDHRRAPHIRTYGGLGSGLYRSDDGGDTWERLENIETLAEDDDTGLTRCECLGRIGVAIAPSNPDRVYVITGHTFGDNKGFYVSDDGGDSFNAADYPGSQGGFQWWFGRLWVDPADQEHLFVAGVSLRESFDGGQSWSSSSGVHADQHAMAWAEEIPNRVYLGNDGGMYRSDTNGASREWTFGIHQPYMQIYMFDVGEQHPDRLVAGFQDQGSWRSWTGENQGDPDNWARYNGGDGLHTLIDPENNDIYYGCSQYGSCSRFAPQPIGNRRISSGTSDGRRNWNAPVVFDPNSSEILYFGGESLDRSTDRGNTWTNLSEGVDLTGDWTTHGGEEDPVYGRRWGTITAVDISKTAPDTIYVGTDTGRLWKTDDLGETWHEFVDVGLPQRWVTRVAIDPDNEDVVYATFSGYRSGEEAAHVFKTTDGGRTWSNVSGNLPNGPVNDVVIDKANSTVYVGTDVGVFFLKNGKKNWKPAGGEGLPLAPVLDIRLHQPSNTLFASTFGRGAFKLDLGS